MDGWKPVAWGGVSAIRGLFPPCAFARSSRSRCGKPRGPRIVAVLEKLGNAPGSYVARIHPTTTEAPFESLVDVELAAAGGARRTIHLYAVIRATPIDKNL